MEPAYTDSAVSVYCGNASQVLSEHPIQADLILTSPPYDNLRNYGGHEFDFYAMADTCVSSLTEGGVLVWIVADATINGSKTGSSFRQALAFMERGLNLHDVMIYEKDAFRVSNTRYASAIEYMFILSNGVPKTVNLIRDRQNKNPGHFGTKNMMGRKANGERPKYAGRRTVKEFGLRTTIWRYSSGHSKSAPDFPEAHDHPAIFPLALAEDHIKTWTNEGDLVLDPMAGSGTTLAAAKHLNRLAVGVEIHENYVMELIVNRIRNKDSLFAKSVTL